MDRSTAHSDPSRRLKQRLRRELRWLRLRLVGHALLMLLGGLGLLFGVAVLAVPGWSELGRAGAWAVWAVAALATRGRLVVPILGHEEPPPGLDLQLGRRLIPSYTAHGPR